MDDWCRKQRQGKQGEAVVYGSAADVSIDSCEISYAAINSDSLCSTTEGDSSVTICGKRVFQRPFWREVREILSLHIPFFFTCFFQFFLQTISVIMCGHLSANELAAAALACTLINVGAIGVGVGVSTACDTYFSQTFGSGNKKRVGLYLQRSLIVMYMVLIPVLCLQLNIEPVLIALGQEEEISRMAAEYMLIFLPGIFFDYTFLILSRYLQNQNMVFPPLVCAIAGNVFNACAQFVAIHLLGMRYQASAACQAASLFIMCAGIICYILTTRVYEDTWDGWSREAIYDLGGFMRLAIPGLILTLLEDLSYEVGTFVAGVIDSVQLGAQGIVFQTATLSFMLQLAMSIAVNIRVGHQLGAKDAAGARHTFKVAHVLMTVMTFALSATILLTRSGIARIFTSSAAVQEEAEGILFVFTFFVFIDSFTITNNGMLKGCGKQVIAAVFNVVGYEFVGVPIGMPLSLLTDLKIKGFWLGQMAGVTVSGIIFSIIIARLDWSELLAAAQLRAFGEQHVEAVQSQSEQQQQEVSMASSNLESASLLSGQSRCRSYSGRYENLVAVNVQTVPQVLGPNDRRKMVTRRLVTVAVLLLLAAGSVWLRLHRQAAAAAAAAASGNFTTAAAA